MIIKHLTRPCLVRLFWWPPCWEVGDCSPPLPLAHCDELFLKYFIEYLLFCSTHCFDIELYDILYSMLCKLYILRICVLDQLIHCTRVWCEIIKIVEHRLDFHLGSCKRFDEVENVSGNSFFDWYRILFWNFEICTISLSTSSFVWWCTLMKN